MSLYYVTLTFQKFRTYKNQGLQAHAPHHQHNKELRRKSSKHELSLIVFTGKKTRTFRYEALVEHEQSLFLRKNKVIYYNRHTTSLKKKKSSKKMGWDALVVLR